MKTVDLVPLFDTALGHYFGKRNRFGTGVGRRVISWFIFCLFLVAGTHSWLGYLCVRQSGCSLDPLSLLRRVSGSAEVAGSDSASLLEHFVETLALRLETWSFLCLRLMIRAGVILALRLDSSGIKKGEFRTGHPQTLNKNAVAPFMNSRCQVLHPQIYFLLWFLFKKGCACVMSSSWWGLTAQHYATKINHMLCRSPWHGTVRSSTWGQPCFRILHIVPVSVCLSDSSQVYGQGQDLLPFFSKGKLWNLSILIFFPKPVKSTQSECYGVLWDRAVL